MKTNLLLFCAMSHLISFVAVVYRLNMFSGDSLMVNWTISNPRYVHCHAFFSLIVADK